MDVGERKVLITSRSFGRVSDRATDLLKEAGCRLVFGEGRGPFSKDVLKELMADVDGVILGTDVVDDEVLAAAPRLKVISRNGVGLDSIDIKAAQRRGIVVANVPGTNVEAVAELTMGLMIALARRLPQSDRLVRSGQWQPAIGVELKGKRLGIIGLGQIGRRVAAIAQAFGMIPSGYDLFADPEELKASGIHSVTFDEVVSQSDFITLHVPLTPDTRHLINHDVFSRMKEGVFLVNVSRGGVVDENALFDAVHQGKVAGAAVDVFEQEPPGPAHPLLNHPDIIVTPHMGASTQEAVDGVSIQAARNVIDVLSGKPCANSVTI